MKNKILALGISFTFLFAINPKVYASENSKVENEQAKVNLAEENDYIFNVTDISENQVTLSYVGENRDDSVVISADDQNTNLVLDQDFFEDDISLKDEYQIKSHKNIKQLKKDDIKKEDLTLIQKYEKPVNMDKDKIPENNDIIDVEVSEVFANDPVNKAADVFEVGDENNLFSVSFDDLRDSDVHVGDRYKIYWDGIVMESYPGQFGEIYRVEKLSGETVENWQSKEFELIEIRDSKDGKEALLKEIRDGQKTYRTYLDKLEDKNAKIGDRYLITYNNRGDEMTQIQNVEKWMKKEDPNLKADYSELNKIIDEASNYVFEDQTYTQESADNLLDAFTKAKELLKKTDARQEEVDEASKNLRYAIDNIKEDKDVKAETTEYKSVDDKKSKIDKKENTKAAGVEETKKDKKSVFGNPSTGISSIAPIAITAMLAGAGVVSSKKNK